MSLIQSNNVAAHSKHVAFRTQNAMASKLNEAISVQNAAEEMTLHLSEREQEKMRKARERKFSSRELRRQVERVEALREAYEALSDPKDHNALNRDAFALLGGMRTGRPAQSLVEEKGSEAVKQLIISKHARYLASEKHDAAIIEQLDNLVERLIEFHGPEIQAGLNIARPVAEHYDSGDSRAQIRETYYEAVLGAMGVRGIFHNLLERFGEYDFAKSIDTFTSAIAVDLTSPNPSTSTRYLRELQRDLEAANDVRTLVQDSSDLITSLKRTCDYCLDSPVELARHIFNLTDSSIFDGELEAAASDMVGGNRSNQLIFFNGLYDLMNKMPETMWDQSTGRAVALERMLQHMEFETRKEIGPHAFYRR